MGTLMTTQSDSINATPSSGFLPYGDAVIEGAREKLRSAPHNGSDTSKAAAESVVGKAATYRRRVFEFIEGAGRHGVTDIEIQIGTGMSGNTERPRRIKLVEDGIVMQKKGVDGMPLKAVRKGSNLHCAVWVAAKFKNGKGMSV